VLGQATRVACATLAVLLAVLLSVSTGCGSTADGSDRAIPTTGNPTDGPARQLVPRVVATSPHDPDAFTQGLELVDGRLFESTGLYGVSDIREVDRATGRVLRSSPLEVSWFGEGVTAVDGGRAVQLTWKAGRAVVWDLASLTAIDVWTYGGQGWGLCLLDAGTLAMSDGSSFLTLRRSDDLTRISEVPVVLDGRPVERLNELECVDGTVWANVWLTDDIVAIDPSTGRVTAVVDASGLLADRSGLGEDDVLNGIAHDPTSGHFLVTGKRWPVLFEVVFEPDPDR